MVKRASSHGLRITQTGRRTSRWDCESTPARSQFQSDVLGAMSHSEERMRDPYGESARTSLACPSHNLQAPSRATRRSRHPEPKNKKAEEHRPARAPRPVLARLRAPIYHSHRNHPGRQRPLIHILSSKPTRTAAEKRARRYRIFRQQRNAGGYHYIIAGGKPWAILGPTMQHLPPRLHISCERKSPSTRSHPHESRPTCLRRYRRDLQCMPGGAIHRTLGRQTGSWV